MPMSNLDQRFLRAAMNDPLEKVKALLAEGANYRVKDETGTDALLHAAQRNPDPEVVNFFIESRMNLDTTNRKKERLIHAFANKGRVDLLTKLLDNGEDPNVQNGIKETPLLYAAMAGRVEAMKLLISRGADVTLAERKNRTPLHYAASMEVVDMLAAAGADLNAADNWGDTPLIVAAAFSTGTGICRALIDHGANIDQQALDGTTALLRAANDGHFETVMLLLDSGANTELANTRGTVLEKLAKKKPALKQILDSRKALQAIQSVIPAVSATSCP